MLSRLNRSALLARRHSLGMSIRILGEFGKHAPKAAVAVFQNGLGIDAVEPRRQKDCRFDISLRLLERECRLA
jgi:hypothetical protein